MVIKSRVFEKINSLDESLGRETGAILGSSTDMIVDHIRMDSNDNSDRFTYFPNVPYLNGELEKWQDQGVQFVGILHTHYYGIETLSEMDIEYIHLIFDAMPKETICLFFPIYVFPDHKAVCYRAAKQQGVISIERDIFEIIP